MHVSFPDLIAKKRDGHELSDEEIRTFVSGVADGTMDACQIGQTHVMSDVNHVICQLRIKLRIR